MVKNHKLLQIDLQKTWQSKNYTSGPQLQEILLLIFYFIFFNLWFKYTVKVAVHNKEKKYSYTHSSKIFDINNTLD